MTGAIEQKEVGVRIVTISEIRIRSTLPRVRFHARCGDWQLRPRFTPTDFEQTTCLTYFIFGHNAVFTSNSLRPMQPERKNREGRQSISIRITFLRKTERKQKAFTRGPRSIVFIDVYAS